MRFTPGTVAAACVTYEKLAPMEFLNQEELAYFQELADKGIEKLERHPDCNAMTSLVFAGNKILRNEDVDISLQGKPGWKFSGGSNVLTLSNCHSTLEIHLVGVKMEFPAVIEHIVADASVQSHNNLNITSLFASPTPNNEAAAHINSSESSISSSDIPRVKNPPLALDSSSSDSQGSESLYEDARDKGLSQEVAGVPVVKTEPTDLDSSSISSTSSVVFQDAHNKGMSQDIAGVPKRKKNRSQDIASVPETKTKKAPFPRPRRTRAAAASRKEADDSDFKPAAAASRKEADDSTFKPSDSDDSDWVEKAKRVRTWVGTGTGDKMQDLFDREQQLMLEEEKRKEEEKKLMLEEEERKEKEKKKRGGGSRRNRKK